MIDDPAHGDSSDGGTEPTAPGLPEPALAAEAISRVLQPLARLMIDHGLQLPSLVDLLKKALVDEAARAYGVADKGSSDTRISLLTGVHRKDVKRLRDGPQAPVIRTPMVPIAASVVARWISDPRFLTADQSSRPLARTPSRGLPGEPDFPTLVSEVSRDVGARAVLDELVRLGVVELRDDGFVVLKTEGFLPTEGRSESFHFLAANVAEHLAAAVHNLAPDRVGPPKLEQSAFAEDLSAPQVQELQQLARRMWTKALRQFLQTATLAWERREADTGPKYRVRFGVYFNDTPQDAHVVDDQAAVTTRMKNRKPKT
jgi:hypothetical protein